MKAAGIPGQSPWIYAVQFQPTWTQPTIIPGTTSEIDVSTLGINRLGNVGSAFNFASLLYLNNGERTWEDLPGGFGSQGNTWGSFLVHRRPVVDSASHAGLASGYNQHLPDFVNYYLVSTHHDTSLRQ